MLNFYDKVVLDSTSGGSLLDYLLMSICLLYKIMTCHYIAEFLLSFVFLALSVIFIILILLPCHEETVHIGFVILLNSLHDYAA